MDECRTCKHCIKSIINNEYYNMECAKGTVNFTGTVRIASYVKDNELIPLPTFCQLKQTPYQMWQAIKPQISWDEIKPGDVFHIPPYNGMKRSTITVVGKCGVSYFTYRKEGSSGIEFMYPTYTAYKVMVKKK